MMLHLFQLPPEVLLHVIKLLDSNSKHRLRLSCKYAKQLVDEPSLWRNITLKLKQVDTNNKPFWKTLKARQIRHLSLINVKHLMPKHYELLFKQLCCSLVSLETHCTLIHIDKRVLSKFAINKLEQLNLHCGLPIVPCEGCHTYNLTKFTNLKYITFHNVTNTYLQHISRDLNKVNVANLEVLKILGTGVPLSKLRINEKFATAIVGHKNLKEICIPEYSQIEDGFFESYNIKGEEGPNIQTLQLLGNCNIKLVSGMLKTIGSSLTTVYLCVEAEMASSLMAALNSLKKLTSLGIKFESVPKEPHYYSLERLPIHLDNLSLAFELSVSPMVPPLGQKLLRSGSKWFPGCVLTCLPKELRGRLKVFWIATVILNVKDVDVLLEDYTSLGTLTCRFEEDLHFTKLTQLSSLPRLRSLYLHGVKFESDILNHQPQPEEEERNMTKKRIDMYTTVYPLFILPSFTMQERNCVSRFRPLPKSALFGNRVVLGSV